MLLLSKPFKIVEAQNEKIAMDFCAKIGELITSDKYNDEVVVSTVDSILLTLKDQDLIEAIKKELLICYPHMKWTFKKQK